MPHHDGGGRGDAYYHVNERAYARAHDAYDRENDHVYARDRDVHDRDDGRVYARDRDVHDRGDGPVHVRGRDDGGAHVRDGENARGHRLQFAARPQHIRKYYTYGYLPSGHYR